MHDFKTIKIKCIEKIYINDIKLRKPNNNNIWKVFILYNAL